MNGETAQKMAQDAVRCSQCTNVVVVYCRSCGVNLCRECRSKHLENESLKHEIEPYMPQASSTDKCKDHSKENVLYCHDCTVPICFECLLGNHEGHRTENLSKITKTTQSAVQNDLLELRHFKNEYENVVQKMKSKFSEYAEYSKKETDSLEELREAWHEMVNVTINKFRKNINDMVEEDNRYMQDSIEEIQTILQNVEHCIQKNEKLLKDNNILNLLKYESTIEELRLVPSRIEILPPKIIPSDVKEEEIMKQLLTLKPSNRTTLPEFAISKTCSVSAVSARLLLKEPKILATLKTNNRKLKGICCESTDRVWVYGDDEKLKQFDKLGTLLNSITAVSGNSQKDIAVNKDGDIAFPHITDECIKVFRKGRVEKMVELAGWIPFGLCFNTDDALMVCMRRTDYSEAKIGIFSGGNLIKEIQFDDKKKALFSVGRNNMYITENGNGDICVSDWNASAVVVTKKSGEFRFRYTGNLSRSHKEFYPHGIDTDNYCRILIVDRDNDCVHVVDRNGKFLRYINCSLKDPFVISIDSDENLWVGENSEACIKVIKYLD
ncbi:E3 ubiquitin-protein ligase TRIM71-like [Saccostrea echinata]|uniref:E3 ubiquitin-protein ligase TRIM71-like n=1 Tax=Saccostrea echinata TaxID=191078 RepID=UPI002A82D144|nr:E3 ubiquitin-protein ligase TRIM71-like [Saccostrea echinata]XP_061172304.1 E3 ubiquitin-protein ligase TRIM71-like [Saccostrea echinata]